MRIAIVGSRHLLGGYSGVERGLQQFLPFLVQRGHSVTVFGGAMPETSNVPNDTDRKDRYQGIKMVKVPCVRGKHTETLSRSAVATAMALRLNYDVVHFQHQGPGIFSLMTRLSGKPSIVTVCGLDWKRAKWSGFARFSLRSAERVAVACASQIVVLSPGIQDYFVKTYKRSTTLIPNGLPQTLPPVDRDVLERYRLEPEGYVLFAARLVPEKGCHDLIAAWNGINTQRKLVIAGAGEYAGEYVRALHNSADPQKGIIFVGHLDTRDLAQIMANAYLFVLPSMLEGMSNALLEAMALGRVSLVSDIPENLNTIDRAGFSFRAGDVVDLRAALVRLLRDETSVRSMMSRVVTVTSSCPTWKDVALRHEAVYAAASKSSVS